MNDKTKISIKTITLTLFLFLTTSMIYAQKNETRTEILNRKGLINEILNYSNKDISQVSSTKDLKMLGELFNQNGLFEKSVVVYEHLKLLKIDEFDMEDILNYSQALIETNKFKDEYLDFNVEGIDQEWIKHMKNVANARSFYVELDEQQLITYPIDVNFKSIYGITSKADTLYFYSKDNSNVQAGLFETELILSNRKSKERLSKGVWNGTDIENISSLSVRGERRKKIVSCYKLLDSNDALYTYLPTKDGTINILVKSDLLPDFKYNSKQFDCAMPYYDQLNKTLYYCSNNPKGYGGWDIYKSVYSEGKWLEPINLGKEVNTPFNEIFPNKYQDGFSFASDARMGKGGFDNYYYSDNDSVSINLHPYNSVKDDYSLVNVKGQILGIKNNQLVLYSDGKKFAQAKLVQDHKDLLLFVNPIKENPHKIIDSVINGDLDLLVIKPNPKAEIESDDCKLFFDFDKSDLSNENLNKLDLFSLNIKHANKKPQSVLIVGYTDTVGDEKYNLELAYSRVLGPLCYLKDSLKTVGVDFIPVICGELLSVDSYSDALNRKVNFLTGKRKFKFKIILAVRNENANSLDDFIKPYNITKDDFEMINKDLQLESEKDDVFFVGIQALHKVKYGETLSEISESYGVNVGHVKTINGLKSDVILEAAFLIIPMACILKTK